MGNHPATHRGPGCWPRVAENLGELQVPVEEAVLVLKSLNLCDGPNRHSLAAFGELSDD